MVAGLGIISLFSSFPVCVCCIDVLASLFLTVNNSKTIELFIVISTDKLF